MTRRQALLVAALCFSFASKVSAQRPAGLDLGGDYATGGEAERYLRAAQLAGFAKPTAWTIRSLLGVSGSPSSWASVHPWSSRFTGDSTHSSWSLHLLRPNAKLLYNSSFPTLGDGPAWAGRGITGEVQAGIVSSLGRLHLQVAPQLFLSENHPFTLAVNTDQGAGALRDARYPEVIDAPQRFGTGAYGRLDTGNSSLWLDLPGTVLGVSTAAQSWGPAREFPLILSGNSGGFAHAFIGTKTPLDLKLFSLHTKLIAGRLEQSPFSPIDTGPKPRWASAIIIAIIPRGISGLELGVTRFVEAPLYGSVPTLKEINRVFSGTDINIYQNIEAENQIASAFFRWGFPGAGVELYGEYAREDYSLDFRRFVQYPDDLRSYLFGFQRAVKQTGNRMRSVGFELVNAELSSSNRGERGDLEERKLHQPFPPYLHGIVRQGHTNRGLFLGSPEAYGGAAWRGVLDQFSEKGRTSFSFERSLQLDWLPGTRETSDETHPDVMWALGFERLRFAGKRDYTFSLTAMLDANRNLVTDHDVFNVRATLGVRGWRR